MIKDVPQNIFSKFLVSGPTILVMPENGTVKFNKAKIAGPLTKNFENKILRNIFYYEEKVLGLILSHI